MEFAYEARVAELRAEVDRITSRQMLDQEQFDHKLQALLKRQAMLEQRTSAITGDVLTTGSIKPARIAPAEARKPVKPSPISDTVIFTAPPDHEARLQSREQAANPTRFANGANGLLNLHSQTGTGDQFFEAVGTGRTVRVTGFEELHYYSANRWAPSVNARQGQIIRFGHGTMRGDAMGYRTEFQNFAKALLAGEAPSPSIPDGYESTRLAEAFYASILTGQPVKVTEAPVIEV